MKKINNHINNTLPKIHTHTRLQACMDIHTHARTHAHTRTHTHSAEKVQYKPAAEHFLNRCVSKFFLEVERDGELPNSCGKRDPDLGSLKVGG